MNNHEKIMRGNLCELALLMPVINEIHQKTFICGVDGSHQNPYTQSEYESMSASGTLKGGYVDGWGFTFGDVAVTESFGGSGNSNTAGSGSGNFGYDPNQWGGHGDPAFWGIPSGNQDYSGSNSGNWWEDIFNSGETGGTYYGGGCGGYYGGSSSGSNGSSSPGGSGSGSNGDSVPPENQVKWESIEEIIFIRFIALGIDLSKYTIIVEDGTGNAGIDRDGNIILRDSFFYRPSCDQESVLGHEIIHKDKDVPYDPKKNPIKEEDFNFSPEMSDDEIEYYKSINCGNTIEEILDYSNGYYLFWDGNLSDPQKYLNEINAYEEEMRLFPNVSEEYRREREAKLSFYKQVYRMALDAQSNNKKGGE